MTDENTDPVGQQDDLYTKLKEEMQTEFSTLKEAFEAERRELNDTIAKLTEQNQGLQRALVRQATTEPPAKAEEHIPTEEELYAAEVERCAQNTKEKMKELL